MYGPDGWTDEERRLLNLIDKSVRELMMDELDRQDFDNEWEW